MLLKTSCQDTNKRSQAGRSTLRQSFVETVEATSLEGLSTAYFEKFRKNRIVYKKHVAEKI